MAEDDKTTSMNVSQKAAAHTCFVQKRNKFEKLTYQSSANQCFCKVLKKSVAYGSEGVYKNLIFHSLYMYIVDSVLLVCCQLTDSAAECCVFLND